MLSYEHHGKEPLMNSVALKILLTVYILYALLKFFEFFFRRDETKRKGLYAVYVKGGGAAVKIFDNVMLAFMLVLLGLLFWGGVECVSFTTGLLVGMTVIQVYFHRFFEPLPPEKSPEPPITALKMLSYSSGKSRTCLAGAGSDDNPFSLGSLYAWNAGTWPLHASRRLQAVIIAHT
jgi:hypothetical protein